MKFVRSRKKKDNSPKEPDGHREKGAKGSGKSQPKGGTKQVPASS